VHLGVDRQGNCRVLVEGRELGAFFAVHMTICEPFQVNAIGILRGVPSLAT